MRSLRISSLNHLKETRTITLNGTELEIESVGTFVNNSSGTASCSENESSPDYVRITSNVRQKNGQGSTVTLQSVISPSNGSLDPTHGSVVVAATNAKGEALQGLVLTGSGAGSFSGETDENGCAIFADLTAGEYTLTPSGVGLVGKFGEAPTGQSLTVSGNQTQRVPLLYDKPAKLRIPFYYKLGATSFGVVPEDVALYDAEMGTSAKSYEPTTEEIGSTKYAALSSLFPFKTAVTVYAGACENKNVGTEAMATVNLVAGGTVTASQVRMPALEVTVTSNGSTRVQGAKVVITDEKCSGTKYTYTTEANGHQSLTTTGAMAPALPWSTYKVCASANISGTQRRIEASGVNLETVASTVTKSLNLSGTGSESGSTKICS
jgi:hypothetical protein